MKRSGRKLGWEAAGIQGQTRGSERGKKVREKGRPFRNRGVYSKRRGSLPEGGQRGKKNRSQGGGYCREPGRGRNHAMLVKWGSEGVLKEPAFGRDETERGSDVKGTDSKGA